ncbi:MAG: hypothetical protein JWN86_4350 [Planctomycetota bacterium]|nr:hypothetical protein [Planctomycetota bacterium]
MVPFLRQAFLSSAVASAVAFLGAIPLASAAGFYEGDDMRHGNGGVVVFSSGALLFFLTLALIGPLTRVGASVASSLARSETRPAPAIALGLIACGTLCVICSLWFAWSSRDPMAPTVKQMEQSMANLKTQGFNNVNFTLPGPSNAAGSPGPMILDVLAFFLGTSLIGLGVWASFSSATSGAAGMDHYSTNHVFKAPIPGTDEARL